MNDDPQPTERLDRIVRSLLEKGRARVVAVTATAAVKEMARLHGIVGLPAIALGRTALSGLLLATLTKDEEQVTLQVLGDGPLGGITVDARSSGRVRGFVKRPAALTWDAATSTASRIAIGHAVGNQGVITVIRDLGLAQNYSGQVALQSGEIEQEVERYLNTSEQIDSVLRCEVLVDGDGAVTAAAGLLVQTLPQAHGAEIVEHIRETVPDAVFWNVLRDTASRGPVDPVELTKVALGPTAASLDVLEQREVSFFCPCSRARAEATLSLLRPEDLQQMMLETNDAEVTCNFCGSRYRFDEVELDKLRRKNDPRPQN